MAGAETVASECSGTLVHTWSRPGGQRASALWLTPELSSVDTGSPRCTTSSHESRLSPPKFPSISQSKLPLRYVKSGTRPRWAKEEAKLM